MQFPNDPASPNYDGPFPDGTYKVEAKATNALGSVTSNAVTFTLKTTKPNVPTGLHLKSGDDSGIVGDSITNVRKPHFDGTADPGSTIQLFKTGAPTTVLGTATADASGNFSIQLASSLVDGTISLSARSADGAGNVSAASNAVSP